MSQQRIGSWVLGHTSLEEARCIDCRKTIPRGEPAWRTRGGPSYGRRVCAGCMDRRQQMRGRSVA